MNFTLQYTNLQILNNLPLYYLFHLTNYYKGFIYSYVIRCSIFDKNLAMLKASIGDNTYKIDLEKKKVIVDGKPFDFDLAKLSDGNYHVISSNTSYSVELVKLDTTQKIVVIKVNNKVYQVALKDKMDDLLEKLGMDSVVEAKTVNLKAPMPGLILDIAVEKGQVIAKGDKLLILEAMKMENVIKATSDAVIEDIKVNIGDSVDNGQILMSFE